MLGECCDAKGELLIYEHCRPHWSQAGSVVFITFRTNDSIPADVARRWDREKQRWLRRRGHETGAHWSVVVQELPESGQAEFNVGN